MLVSNKSKCCLLIAVFITTAALSQSEWKNWDGIGVDLGLSKKFGIGLNHLRAYSISHSFQNNFNQTTISADYDFTKKSSVKAGFAITEFPSDAVSEKKYFTRISYKIPIGEILNWSNGLQGEVHSAKGTSYRVIYITRLALQHRIGFLRLSPSISYWLFYNIGGNAIQYFDESGSPLAKQTPDGLHRGRVTLNLNSKITRNLSLSLYYMSQHEFNLSGNDINVVNPRTGKVARPFKNYQVAGLSLSFSFDLYKKHNGQNKK
jgi:hypothetical protein